MMTSNGVSEMDRKLAEGARREKRAQKIRRIVWPLILVAIVAIFIAFIVSGKMYVPGHEAPIVESPEVIAADPTPEPPSPEEQAASWQANELKNTPFSGLNNRRVGDGFFWVYTAQSGDSIGRIVDRYVITIESEGLGSMDRNEVLRIAKSQHTTRYKRDMLRIGDEILLVIPNR